MSGLGTFVQSFFLLLPLVFWQLLANIRICRFSPWFVFGTAWLPFAGVHCKMPACQSAESVQNNTHQPTKTVQRKHCMQSTFEDDICCVSNIIVYDKVSDDFIFLSIKDTCPNQNLVAHHQFLENLPGKASMYAFMHLKLISNLQGFYQYIMAGMLNLSISI